MWKNPVVLGINRQKGSLVKGDAIAFEPKRYLHYSTLNGEKFLLVAQACIFVAQSVAQQLVTPILYPQAHELMPHGVGGKTGPLSI